MYFKKWPYAIVPEEHANIWADRRLLFSQIKELFENFEQKNSSFIQPLWGYLGAGKTHTLKHFQYALGNKENMVFVYSRFPTQARNFYELYRDGFVQSLNFGLFVKRCSAIWKTLLSDKDEEDAFFWILEHIAHKSYDFAQVVYNFAKLWSASPAEGFRHPYFGLSRMWLQGARLSMRNMKDIGVTKNIKSDEDAVVTIGGILRLMTLKEAYGKVTSVIWMLDDCQALLNKEAIQRGLRRVIDECPRNLLVLISFATTDPEKIRLGLIDELRTVCAPSLLEVPPLNEIEASEFIIDLINNKDFKDPGKDKFYPYTEEAILEIIAQMKNKGIDLLPRCINRCADHLTSEAEKDSIDRIDAEYVKQFFDHKCQSSCPIFSE